MAILPWIRDIQPRPEAWPPPREAPPVAEALRYARRRDPFGDRVQSALGMLAMFLLPLGTTPKEYAWIALAVCGVLRFPFIWRCYTVLLRDALAWVLLAWSAWRAASMLWSPDPVSGFDEFANFRALLLPLVLWPVLDRARWLIAAFLVGVLVQNGAQLAQHMHWFGLHPSYNERLRAFMHPITTGALCAAAASWHLAMLLRPGQRGPVSGASVAGLGAALAGLVGSGSRGPWLAAAAAIPLQVLTGLWRAETRRRSVVITVIGLACAGAAWPVAGDYVRRRLEQASSNLAQAWGGGNDYNTDVGQRLARWDAALRVAVDRPLAGTGGGGYATAIDAIGYGSLARRNEHAHSMYLHEAATTGLIGTALMLGAMLLCLRRLPPGGRGTPWAPANPYADGTVFVLAGWLVGALFDCYQLNGTMFGLFAFIAALCLRHAGASAPRS